MHTQQSELQKMKVSTQLKLASLWTSLMFLYIYVDYFHLYMPGKLADIQNGRVYVFDITPGFLSIALVSLTISALMIFLSVVLPAAINRKLNMIIAAIYIPYTLYNLAGEAWIHMIFGAIVEVVLLGLVICYAWKWPRVENESVRQSE
jgi:hypothetical protein